MDITDDERLGGGALRTVRQWVGETAGGLPRGFWYLWANTLINRVGSFVVIVLAIYLTQERGFSETFAGLVIGLWGVGGAIGTLLGGVLADRWGRRPTFLTALYSSAAIMLVLGLARGQVEIAVAVVLLGLANEAARPAMVALMIDIVPESDRLRAFSLNYWVINVGFAVAATTAGLVAGVDYLLLFAINAATTVAGATVVAVKVREPVRASVRARVERRPARRGRTGSARGLRRPGLHGFRGREPADRPHIHAAHLDAADGDEPGRPVTFDVRHGHRAQRRAHRGRAAVRAAPAAGAGPRADPCPVDTDPGVRLRHHGLRRHCLALRRDRSRVDTRRDAQLAVELRDQRRAVTGGHAGRYQGVFSLSWSAAAFIAPIAGAAVLQYVGNAALWLGCFGVGLVVTVIHLLAGPARARRARNWPPRNWPPLN